MQLALILTFLANVLYFCYIGIKDLKYREISDREFYVAIPLIIAISTYYFFENKVVVLLNLIFGLISFGIVFFFSKFGMMGSGDAYILSYPFFLNPYVVELHGYLVLSGFLIVIYSSLFTIALIFKNMFNNMKYLKEFNELTKNYKTIKRLYFFIFAEVMSREEFLKKKFYFPLVAGNLERLHANVEKEPLDAKEFNVEGDFLIAQYGVPLGFSMLFGIIAHYLLMFWNITPFSP